MNLNDPIEARAANTITIPSKDTSDCRNFMIDNEAIVTEIKCNKCKNVLPPHTVKQHLNENDIIHKCPHLFLK